MIEYGKIIKSATYHDSTVISEKTEYEVSIFSTKDNILKDVIDCMAVLTKRETSKLTLEIKVDAKERYRIIKKWEL